MEKSSLANDLSKECHNFQVHVRQINFLLSGQNTRVESFLVIRAQNMIKGSPFSSASQNFNFFQLLQKPAAVFSLRRN